VASVQLTNEYVGLKPPPISRSLIGKDQFPLKISYSDSCLLTSDSFFKTPLPEHERSKETISDLVKAMKAFRAWVREQMP
jgi:hypothetical protein